MKSLFLVCFVWLGIVGYGQTAPQYPNTNYLGEYNGYYYYSSVNSYNWHQSVAHLKTIDSSFRLLSIHSQAENDFVTNAAFQFYNTHHYLWIGGTDQVSEGNFVWEDNTPWNYDNWGSGEPNNSYDIGEDWVMLNYPHPGKWNDATNTGGDIFYYLFKVKKPEYISLPVVDYNMEPDTTSSVGSTDTSDTTEVTPEDDFKVYPNPLNPTYHTDIYFDLPQSILDKNSILAISDMGGRVIFYEEKVYTSEHYSIPIPSIITAGLYNGVIKCGKKKYKFRLVVVY